MSIYPNPNAGKLLPRNVLNYSGSNWTWKCTAWQWSVGAQGAIDVSSGNFARKFDLRLTSRHLHVVHLSGDGMTATRKRDVSWSGSAMSTNHRISVESDRATILS